MNFNSYIFILAFLPIVLFIYFLLGHFKKYRLSQVSLILSSIIFYGYFKFEYIFLLVISVLINYVLSNILYKNDGKKNKFLLLFSICLNIGILCYFKYLNFMIKNINLIFKSNFDFINVIIPLGISFFTFQQISYLVDSYKKERKEYKFIDYASYIIFFPQLTAGPISLHDEMIHQFSDNKNKHFNIQNFSKGLYAFSLGLFKKIILADTFLKVTNIVFGDPNIVNTTDLIIGMLAYTFQIYFDFSGYCDMGIGISYMFNIKLPINFDSPYKSYSIIEFWKRWHITLTKFFTKYVYIPLGGNRKGKIRTYINIMIVFLISGIWHGANYTFILWGILHGIASIYDRIFKNRKEKKHMAFNWLITFIFINICWTIFRADSLSSARHIFDNILTLNFMPINPNIINAFVFPEFKYIMDIFHVTNLNICLFIFFIASFYIVLGMKNTNEKLEEFKPTCLNAVLTGILFVWSIISITGVTTFIYVNF